jgi:hypothetical protein
MRPATRSEAENGVNDISYMTPLRVKQAINANKTSGGQGVPTGGTTGQILTKKSNTDYDTEWGDGIDTGNNLLFYRPGDTFVCDYDTIMNGYITSGTKNVRVSLPVPKRLDNISSITVESLNVEGRCNKGYLNNQSGDVEYVGKSDYTVEANKSNNNVVNILISKSSAWSNVDNNTLVSLVAYTGNLKLIFN